jgi:hypothetical protein
MMHGKLAKVARARKEPSMNVLLWVLQVALALLYIAGGNKSKEWDQ